MAKKSYVQLTYQDRLYISRLNARKMSVTRIAERLGVHKSTISRELRRNGGVIDVESQLFYAEMTLLSEPKDVLRKHLKELRDYGPAVVDARNRLGDLEGDLIQGYLASGYIVSVVDRKSKYLVLRKVPTKRKRIVRIQLERAIKKMKCAKTLTLDNGSEFCDHSALTQSTQVPVYFAHPYTSSERGTNENSNALVRHFLPKKTCFANLSQSRLNEIEESLNNRPRKCLGYLTPYEVHFNSHPKISRKPLLPPLSPKSAPN